MPLWFSKLENEDVEFIKKFILASGSLKEMARQYGVTYPTVRLRLDKLIQKIKVNEDLENEPYVSLIKRMVIDEKIILLAIFTTEFLNFCTNALIWVNLDRKERENEIFNGIYYRCGNSHCSSYDCII